MKKIYIFKHYTPPPPHFIGPGTFDLNFHACNPLFEKIVDPPKYCILVLANAKCKLILAVHYKNSIESVTDLKERWCSSNSVVGSKKDCGSPLQIQDGKSLLLEPKEVATKFNRFIATIN